MTSSDLGRLTPAQRRALTHMEDQAQRESPAALSRIAKLGSSGICVENSRVALHFHPDRVLATGLSVVQSLIVDGVYRNQFETGISNGGLTAVRGGDRDRWEQRFFGGAYQQPEVTPDERPKYGALDLIRSADGPAPRFGSCYLRLAAPVRARCTFACGDSFLEPQDLGTWSTFEPVLAGLLEAVEQGWTLGADALSRPAGAPNPGRHRLDALAALLTAPMPTADDVATAPLGRSLDEYVEAQVHGDVRLAEDVELLVADPSFATDETGRLLTTLAERYGIPLAWRPGLELDFAAVPDDFRGPAMPPLAQQLRQDFAVPGERLTAAVIGRAAVASRHDPERLQLVKQLWHVLVRYGLS